jgi:hypothetical protein
MPPQFQAPPPQPSALSGANGQPSAPQSPQQIAAPSHGQTVAALRHFHAVSQELKGLLNNPELGKSDLKSEIINGATKLVGDQIISPDEAVTELTTVPDRPFDQRKWVEQRYVQAIQASVAVLSHHQQAVMGTGNYDLETKLHQSDPKNQMSTMRGMITSHYRPRNA